MDFREHIQVTAKCENIFNDDNAKTPNTTRLKIQELKEYGLLLQQSKIRAETVNWFPRHHYLFSKSKHT